MLKTLHTVAQQLMFCQILICCNSKCISYK